MRVCSVENCLGEQKAKKLCGKHYAQFKVHGKIFERTYRDCNKIECENGICKIELLNLHSEKIAETIIN